MWEVQFANLGALLTKQMVFNEYILLYLSLFVLRKVRMSTDVG